MIDYQTVLPQTHANSPAWRRLAVVALAVGGFLVYLWQSVHVPVRRWHDVAPAARPLFIVVVIGLILLVPEIRNQIAAVLDRVRDPSPLQRRLTTLVVWIAASSYLGFTAWHQHRDFFFKTQDEFMYLVQVQAIAHGHLWMPQHPMADFFQEFYIFVRPVTSGMYFPGAALMFAPAVWLHLPYAVVTLIICGGVVAMTYRVTAELIDSVAGLLAALLMIALTAFRSVSLLTLSYMPMALLGLVMVWAYLHWRKNRHYGWAVVLGAAAGWAAVTRPLDAIVFFVPVLVAMAGGWLSAKDRRRGEVSFTLLILTVAAAPFLAMQFAIDKAVSGHFLKTPVQSYEDLFWPGTIGGLRPHMARGTFHPATPLPQFQANYEGFVLPHYRGKARSLTQPFVTELQYALPHYLLFALLPVSVLGLQPRRRIVLWIILPMFPGIYLAWVMFIKWYAIVIAPVVMYSIVLGARVCADAFPRRRAFLTSWLTGSIAALAIVYLPEVHGKPDRPTGSIVMSTFNHAAETIHKPALVFFRYHAEVPNLWKHEQTYNAEAAWFDDEGIVRAHDLGARDIELVKYYANRQPERTVYLFDQGTMELREIGNVKALAENADTLAAKMGAPTYIAPATKPAAVHRARRG